MNKNGRCAYCKAYCATVEQFDPEKDGECRRESPTITVYLDDDNHSVIVSGWPEVEKSEWCLAFVGASMIMLNNELDIRQKLGILSKE
jgi:hypothetical protein